MSGPFEHPRRGLELDRRHLTVGIPEVAATRAVPDQPSDGRLVVGVQAEQGKRRGLRIELGGAEQGLLAAEEDEQAA